MARPRLNDLSPAERRKLAGVMTGWMSDAFIRELHRPDALAQGLEKMERPLAVADAALEKAGLGPLPAWLPTEPIPPEFMVVRPFDDGRPRRPLADDQPAMAFPEAAREPLLSRYCTGVLMKELLGKVLQDYDAALCAKVGGALADNDQAFAAPIYWCWFGWMADVLAELGRTSGYVLRGAPIGTLTATANSDGRLQLIFVAQQHVHVLSTWEVAPGGDWVAKRTLHVEGTGQPIQPVVAPMADGRLQAFWFISGSNALFTMWQAPARDGSWTPATLLPKSLYLPQVAMAACQSHGGRLDLFAIGTDGKLYNDWQNPDLQDWGGWGYIGGAGITRKELSANYMQDDTVLLVHIGSDAQVWVLTQYAHGPCRDPYVIASLSPVERISCAINSGGKLTVFAITAQGVLHASFSNEADGHWEPFGRIADGVREARAARNGDGLLQLFTVDAGTGTVQHRWQESDRSRTWAGPVTLANARGVTQLAPVRNAAGRVELFAVMPDNGEFRLLRAVEGSSGRPQSMTAFTLFF